MNQFRTLLGVLVFSSLSTLSTSRAALQCKFLIAPENFIQKKLSEFTLLAGASELRADALLAKLNESGNAVKPNDLAKIQQRIDDYQRTFLEGGRGRIRAELIEEMTAIFQRSDDLNSVSVGVLKMSVENLAGLAYPGQRSQNPARTLMAIYFVKAFALRGLDEAPELLRLASRLQYEIEALDSYQSVIGSLSALMRSDSLQKIQTATELNGFRVSLIREIANERQIPGDIAQRWLSLAQVYRDNEQKLGISKGQSGALGEFRNMKLQNPFFQKFDQEILNDSVQRWYTATSVENIIEMMSEPFSYFFRGEKQQLIRKIEFLANALRDSELYLLSSSR